MYNNNLINITIVRKMARKFDRIIQKTYRPKDTLTSKISECLRFSFSLSVDVSLSLDSLVGCKKFCFFFLNLPTTPFSTDFSLTGFGSLLNHIITIVWLYSSFFKSTVVDNVIYNVNIITSLCNIHLRFYF